MRIVYVYIYVFQKRKIRPVMEKGTVVQLPL